MLKVGQKVVCIDGSPVRDDCTSSMPLRLVEGAIYTIRSIHTEPNIQGYGVRLEELVNPSIVWSNNTESEWSYHWGRFRPVVDSQAETAIAAVAAGQ